jgi:hypothetical protein
MSGSVAVVAKDIEFVLKQRFPEFAKDLVAEAGA